MIKSDNTLQMPWLQCHTVVLGQTRIHLVCFVFVSNYEPTENYCFSFVNAMKARELACQNSLRDESGSFMTQKGQSQQDEPKKIFVECKWPCWEDTPRKICFETCYRIVLAKKETLNKKMFSALIGDATEIWIPPALFLGRAGSAEQGSLNEPLCRRCYHCCRLKWDPHPCQHNTTHFQTVTLKPSCSHATKRFLAKTA